MMTTLQCLIFFLASFSAYGQEKRKDTNSILIKKISKVHHLEKEQTQKIQDIFNSSSYMGQGSKVSQHPLSSDQCNKSNSTKHIPATPICKHPFMVQLPQSTVCIDQFEFPNIPCEYPVTWVRPIEAQKICKAMGKRLCDAHEWEAGCSGTPPVSDYPFHQDIEKMSVKRALSWMRKKHNSLRQKVWGYGKSVNQKLCSTQSRKTPGCQQTLQSGKGKDIFSSCGSNTYPAGSSPQCRSSIGVYDAHGNAAEHMSIPIRPDQIGKDGGQGYTEMKGSWFIFSTVQAHPDDCHWRAPFWHGTSIQSPRGHANYHLSFRCCSDISEIKGKI